MAVLLAIGLGLIPAPAAAQLAFSCSYTVTPLLDFGASKLPTTQTDIMPVTISVSCTSLLNLLNGLRVCVSLPAGSGGLSTSDRRMVQGGQFINYQIFRNAGRTQVWGAAADAVPLTFTFSLLNLPVTQNIQAYARVIGGQTNKAAGLYESALAPVARRQSYSILGSAPGCQSVTASEETLTSLTARFEVDTDCSVTAPPLDFGTVSSLAISHAATSNLAVTCTLNGAYSIALDGGSVSGNINGRQMRRLAGPEVIAYQLYRDPGHTEPWGNTAGTILNRTGAGAAESIPIYGLVAAQGARPIGRYEDQITVTITF